MCYGCSALVSRALHPSADRGLGRRAHRLVVSSDRRFTEATGRWLHQVGQDADRADRILHGGAWHCIHERFEAIGPCRGQDAVLLRSRLDVSVGHRLGRRESVAPGDGFTPPGQTYQAVAESSSAVGSTGAASKSSSDAAIEKTASLNTVDFLLNIIPQTLVGAFASGDLLQVLFVAILTAIAIPRLPDQGALALRAIDYVAQLLFQIMQLLVKAAPIGALGAMAYTVGSHGLDALTNLVGLMLGFYLTAGLFIAVVLGSIARFSGYSLWRLLKYLKDELLLVLGTSSSETALPGLMQKLQRLGCEKATVGLVVPTGYSFNLDGTNIYMAMAACSWPKRQTRH